VAFEGLKDRVKEKWAEISSQIQETSAFNTMREKFESQTPAVQRAIVAGGAFLLVFLIMYMGPIGYLASSSDNMSEFEENRTLIQGLLRASRTAKEQSPLPPPMDPGSLRGTVERVLHEKQLVPEQIGEMQAIPGQPWKGLPNEVVQNGIAVQIKQLNLKQILDIGNTFQNLGPGTKLIGMDIVQTAGQDHYYDMIARVANFGLAAIAEPAPDAGDGKKKRPPPKGKPAAPNDGVDE
jgi:hypothetical protein